jgi:hypothetical protein
MMVIVNWGLFRVMRYTPRNSNGGSDKCDAIPMDFPSFRNIPNWRFVSMPGADKIGIPEVYNSEYNCRRIWLHQ